MRPCYFLFLLSVMNYHHTSCPHTTHNVVFCVLFLLSLCLGTDRIQYLYLKRLRHVVLVSPPPSQPLVPRPTTTTLPSPSKVPSSTWPCRLGQCNGLKTAYLICSFAQKLTILGRRTQPWSIGKVLDARVW